MGAMVMRQRENRDEGYRGNDPREFGLTKAAYSVKETLELLSIGRTKFYELVDRRDLKITKLGKKSLVYVTDIVALLIRLRDNNVAVGHGRLDHGGSNE
jgi:excisionase family DNA binding protein